MEILLIVPLAQGEGLRDIAARAGITYGCAVTAHDIQTDPAFADAVARECGSITPINDLKMSTVALTPDLNFAPGDSLAAFAKIHHQGFRIHTVEWHKKVPEFVRPLGWWDLFVWLTCYSFWVTAHYPQALSVDVVNETLPADAPYNFWLDRLSTPAYSYYPPLGGAFWGARWANTGALLLISDWGIEDDQRKQAELLVIVRQSLAWGIPIGGVGIQSHLWRFINADKFSAFVAEVRSLGLKVVVSELTVQSEYESQAAALLYSYIRLCKRVGITDITTWGVSSRYTKPQWRWSMPLNNNLQQSTAWHAIAAGMR